MSQAFTKKERTEMSSTSPSPADPQATATTNTSEESNLKTESQPGTPLSGSYYAIELKLHSQGYKRSESIEFAQLFIGDDETIHFQDEPKTWPTTEGRWVQGWFFVSKEMVERYRRIREEA